MAITNNGLNLKGDALDEATALGATIPANTEFTDFQYLHEPTIIVTKASVENASATVTFDAIVASLQTTLNAQVTNDYDATKTITSFATCSKISEDGDDPKYTDSVTNYTCLCRLFVKEA